MENLLEEMAEVIKGFEFVRVSDVVKRTNGKEYMKGYVDGLKKMEGVVKAKILPDNTGIDR